MGQQEIRWNKGRDKYGRTTYTAYRGSQSVGAIVLLPKHAADMYYDGRRYLTNDWTAPRIYPSLDGTPTLVNTSEYVTYHPNLNKAKAHLVSVVR